MLEQARTEIVIEAIAMLYQMITLICGILIRQHETHFRSGLQCPP